MRRLLALVLLTALALGALPARAATPVLAAVQPGDPDVNTPLQNLRGQVAFLDTNGNGKPDSAMPDEPIYLDLDNSGAVSYGDLRLTPFDTYPAGSVVDQTNRDVGRLLTAVPNAWFAHMGSTWVLDMDGSGTLTVGDILFGATPAKVHAGDPNLGAALDRPASAQNDAFGWSGSGSRDPTHTFYAEMDAVSGGGGRVNAGDLRITPSGFGADNAPTRAEFDAAQRAASAGSASGAGGGGPGSASASGTASPSSPSAWRGLDWVLAGLGVLNLAGLVAVARQVNHLRGPPRNPFK